MTVVVPEMNRTSLVEKDPPDTPSASRHPRGQHRLLMISSAFPPIGGPGVQRSAKFAKYLPQFGWLPVVWCADHDPHLPRDESLLADLPHDLQVHRPERRVARRSTNGAAVQGWRGGFDWRVRRYRDGLFKRMIPDHMIGWAWRSRRPACRLIARERIDAVYSTFSPASNHVLGWMLHRATGLPWIADFRDLWTDDYCYPDHGPIRRRLERRIEQGILENASAVIGVSEAQTEILRRRVPHQPDKFVTITNGVDVSDFQAIDRPAAQAALHGPKDRFVLAFTGWFLTDRVTAGLIEGLGRFARWVASLTGDFELRIVGAIGPNMVRQLNAAGIRVTTTGYLPHDQAIRQMVAADVLLLLAPTGRNGATLIPGKAFEYLAARRPILFVGPDGEAARLIRDCRAGVTIAPDADPVHASLMAWWQMWQRGDLVEGCPAHLLEHYSRESLAGKLADLLNRVHAAAQL